MKHTLNHPHTLDPPQRGANLQQTAGARSGSRRRISGRQSPHSMHKKRIPIRHIKRDRLSLEMDFAFVAHTEMLRLLHTCARGVHAKCHHRHPKLKHATDTALLGCGNPLM